MRKRNKEHEGDLGSDLVYDFFSFFSLNDTRHQSGPCLKFEIVLLTM